MRKWLFELFFQKWIPFKWIDGNKTNIARTAAFIGAVLLLVAKFFPEYALFVTEAQALLATILGLIGVEIGKLHKEDKAQG